MKSYLSMMRYFGLLLMSASLFVIFPTMAQAGEASLTPILPLQYGTGALPLFTEALRDPSMLSQMPRDELALDSLTQKIQDLENELAAPHAKKGQLSRTEEKLYQSYLVYSYYMEDTQSGRNGNLAGAKSAFGDLAVLRAKVVAHGKAYAAGAKNNALKARALYNVLIARYLIDHEETNSAAGLAKIRNLLSPALKSRVDLFLAHKSPRSKESVARLVASYKALSADGHIAAGLLLANSYQTLQGGSSYRAHLAAATSHVAALSPAQKTEVLGYAIGVWRKAEKGEKGAGSWSTPPFALKNFSDSEQVKAIAERSALRDVREGRFHEAMAKYQRLAAHYADSNNMRRIDQRIVEISWMQAKKSDDLLGYAATLTAMENKYKDSAAAADKAPASAEMYRSFNARHRQLVALVTARAIKKDAKPNFRDMAIKIAQTYAEHNAEGREKMGVMVKVAQIHRVAGHHAPAVAIYKDLLTTAESAADKKALLTLAIDSQSQLASWPNEAPWLKPVKKGDLAARQELLGFYTAMWNLDGNKTDWPLLAQIGHLEIQLGQGGEAFTMWTKALADDSSSPHAQRAAGLMLVAHKKFKHWDFLESLARLCLKNNMMPLAGQMKLNARDYLGDALYFGGSAAYAAKDYKKSSEKLAEFVHDFKKDLRRDHGLFILAFAYRGLGSHPDAIVSLKTIVEEYPASRYLRGTLLVGGQWSTEMAVEEDTMYFYSRFLPRFPKDEKLAEVRDALIDLYMGRKIYGNVSAIYQEMALNKKLDGASRTNAALSYMEIEERYGDKEKALWAAKEIIKTAGNNSSALARVYALEARLSASDSKSDTISSIEKKLSSLDATNPEVVESLGLVRFLLAQRGAERTKQEIYNLGLTAPEKTLEQSYALFMASKRDYDQVCAIGTSSYCAPAMSLLAQLTKGTIKNLEEIKIQ